MNIRLILSLLLAVVINSNVAASESGICVRAENVGDIDIERLVVSFGTDRAMFESVEAGRKTRYEYVDSALEPNEFEGTIAETTVYSKNIDDMGRRQLERGFYTYSVAIFDCSDRISCQERGDTYLLNRELARFEARDELTGEDCG